MLNLYNTVAQLVFGKNIDELPMEQATHIKAFVQGTYRAQNVYKIQTALENLSGKVIKLLPAGEPIYPGAAIVRGPSWLDFSKECVYQSNQNEAEGYALTRGEPGCGMYVVLGDQ